MKYYIYTPKNLYNVNPMYIKINNKYCNILPNGFVGAWYQMTRKYSNKLIELNRNELILLFYVGIS